MASIQVKLSVNDRPIQLDFFVQEFVDRTISGMLTALKGTCEIKDLQIHADAEQLSINLNNELVPTNPFVTKIFRNTVFGMVSPLKGVSDIASVDITIKK